MSVVLVAMECKVAVRRLTYRGTSESCRWGEGLIGVQGGITSECTLNSIADTGRSFKETLLTNFRRGREGLSLHSCFSVYSSQLSVD